MSLWYIPVTTDPCPSVDLSLSQLILGSVLIYPCHNWTLALLIYPCHNWSLPMCWFIPVTTDPWLCVDLSLSQMILGSVLIYPCHNWTLPMCWFIPVTTDPWLCVDLSLSQLILANVLIYPCHNWSLSQPATTDPCLLTSCSTFTRHTVHIMALTVHTILMELDDNASYKHKYHLVHNIQYTTLWFGFSTKKKANASNTILHEVNFCSLCDMISSIESRPAWPAQHHDIKLFLSDWNKHSSCLCLSHYVKCCPCGLGQGQWEGSKLKMVSVVLVTTVKTIMSNCMTISC